MWYFVLFPGKSDAAIHVLFPLSVRGRYVTLFTVLCAHYSLHFYFKHHTFLGHFVMEWEMKRKLAVFHV